MNTSQLLESTDQLLESTDQLLESNDQFLLEWQIHSIEHAKSSLEQMLKQETDKDKAMAFWIAICNLDEVLKVFN